MTPPQIQAPLKIVCSFLLLACSSEGPDKLADVTLVSGDPSDLPLSGLSTEWEDRFMRGDRLFEQPFRDAHGLGPLYIRQSCNSCHAGDGRGPGAVRKMVVVGADGRTPVSDQSALGYGHTVRPLMAAGAVIAIGVPEGRDDVFVTKREPPAVFGRGYLEAVEDSEIERIADAQAEAGIVSGEINWLEYGSEPNPDTRFHDYQRGERVIGRFGLKARIATLDEFAADAFQGDMGITTELRPVELPNPAGVDDALPGIDLDSDKLNAVADYMRLLRIPKRLPPASDARAQKLFSQTGCANCHVPSLHTRADYPITALADIDAPIYTDLLLHDMGPDFTDGLRESEAGYAEWRTPPLIGLRHMQRYLHDGRAETIEEAIELHGAPESEALGSVERFQALAGSDRIALVQFVSAL